MSTVDGRKLVGRLHPEVKEQWLAALRSGDYPQGQNYLHSVGRDDDDGLVHRYCCLGVLCELAVQAGVIPPGESSYKRESVIMYDDEATLPPPAVAGWAYMCRPHDSVYWAVPDELETSRDLASLNDAGLTFGEIADRIEEGV